MRANSILGRAAAWLAGCLVIATLAVAQTPVPPAAVPVGAPVAQPVEVQPSVNYPLREKDTVHIRVFDEPDLETTATIDNDGNIFFPLLGKANIGGQTIQQATETMTTLLRAYLIKPEVSVEVTSYAKEHFTILGQVNKPGIFDFPDESSLNLLEAIGMAGGYTKIANPSKITIKRMVDGREVLMHEDGKKIMSSRSSDPVFEVLPGDTIEVGEAIF
jgi:polysaccharide export outer membrane protein